MGEQIRCKVVITEKSEVKNSPSNTYQIKAMPVYSDSEENKKFFAATPSGEISLGIVNKETAEKFEVGGEYYVTFERADG